MPLFQSSMAHNAVDEVSSGPSHGQCTKLSLRHLQGWRMGVSLCAAVTGAVLFLNVILTLASVHYGVSGGVSTVQEESCYKTKELDLRLYLLINVLSTTLLAASNYSM